MATKKTLQYGDHQLTIETGEIARFANSVLVSLDDSVVLVTAVGKKEAVAGSDFFRLTVNYQERNYAAGKIPGGYFKREGRPTEKETLTSRLIDRPIRPLFPKKFTNEVQIVATVMSIDPEIDSDIPAMIGASAVLALSGMPFEGPIAAARVGYKDGNYLLNPKRSQLEESELDLIVAGTESAVLMVESQAKELSESVMLGAVMYGHKMMQPVIQIINELATEVGEASWNWQAPDANEALLNAVAGFKEEVVAAYQIAEKTDRQQATQSLYQKITDQLIGEEETPAYAAEDIKEAFNALEKRVVRDKILSGQPRIDGRDLRTVRPLTMRTGVLPRTHGSALFTRGETQAMVTATLGTGRDAQIIDALHGEGEQRDNFMLHYNFPPYCVGETGMMTGPKRREIGHGRLARRGIEAVLPSQEEFPYVLRIVSEITESNGSSSMATVCGTSLALMDAGVPIKAPVAGVAMGLIKEGEQFSVLTDILGDEDHLGDMDFKVAGSPAGVTALQMDIKIGGITQEIMEMALSQAKEARLHILQAMHESMPQARTEMSDYAPRIFTMKVDSSKIRDVIGKGGAMIRSITEETGVTIDIDDTGEVKIFATSGEAADAAIQKIKLVTAVPEVGHVYEGVVARIVDFGAFVTILPGKDGLLHISQIKEERINNVSDFLDEGQQVRVKVLDVDQQGKVKLSMRGIEQTA